MSTLTVMTLDFDSIDSNLGFYSANEFDRVRRFGTGMLEVCMVLEDTQSL